MNDLINLVNEQGVITGRMERSEMKADDRCLAVALWITNNLGDVLLAKRGPRQTVNPNMWSIAVEGMVDIGEAQKDAAQREAFEELGLRNLDIPDAVVGHINHGSSRGLRHKQVYAISAGISVDDIFLEDKGEVAAIKFVPTVELRPIWEAEPDSFVGHFPLFLELFDL